MNAAWDWRPGQTVDLTYSIQGEKPTPLKVDVPFHTPGNRLNTEGGLESTRQLWVHAFHMKPGEASVRAQRPVQAVPWGIFNFPSAPTVKVTPTATHGGFQVALAKDPGILVNPDAGLEVTSIKVAFLGGDPGALTPSSAPATHEAVALATRLELTPRTGFMDIPTALKTPCTTVGAFDLIPFMRWEIRFRTRNPTRLMDPEQVLVKNIRWVNPDMPTAAQPELDPEVMKKLMDTGKPPGCSIM